MFYWCVFHVPTVIIVYQSGALDSDIHNKFQIVADCAVTDYRGWDDIIESNWRMCVFSMNRDFVKLCATFYHDDKRDWSCYL